MKTCCAVALASTQFIGLSGVYAPKVFERDIGKYYIVYWGLYRDNDIRGYIGIMENKMETTIIYWGLYRDNGNLEWKLL